MLARSLALATLLCLGTVSGTHYGSDTEYATAPLGLFVEGSTADGTNVAVAYCQHIDDGLAAGCDPNPGTVAGLGGAFFDTTYWNMDADAAASYGRAVEITVSQLDGEPLGGFAAFGCSDIDDDFLAESCGGTYLNIDEFASLTFSFCVQKDEELSLYHPLTGTKVETLNEPEYDEFIVFVEAYLDLDQIDAGASTGTFRVESEAGDYLGKYACDQMNRSATADYVKIGLST